MQSWALVNVYNLNKIIYKGGIKKMRKIEGLKNELKKYFHEVEVAYDLENGQITDVLLVFRKNSIVYKIEFEDDIFRFNPSIIINHVLRAVNNGTVRRRTMSIEESFLTPILEEFEIESCYIRLIDGCLEYGKGLSINLNEVESLTIQDCIITLVHNNKIYELDLDYDTFNCIENKVVVAKVCNFLQ